MVLSLNLDFGNAAAHGGALPPITSLTWVKGISPIAEGISGLDNIKKRSFYFKFMLYNAYPTRNHSSPTLYLENEKK